MIDKKLFKDVQGRFITQSLFLEFGYNQALAVYTLDDHDKTWRDKLYPSVKRLYLAEDDPTEYAFATKHLYSYAHWERLCTTTTILKPHIDAWRRELRIRLRSQGVADMIKRAGEDNACTAAKWLAEGKFDLRAPGAPSKADREETAAIEAGMVSEVGEDLERIKQHLSKAN